MAVVFLLGCLALIIGLAVGAAVIYGIVLGSHRYIGQLFKLDMVLIRWFQSTSIAQRQVGTLAAGSDLLAGRQESLVEPIAKRLKPITDRIVRFIQIHVIYALTVNEEPIYSFDTVAATYHLPQDVALDSIASCLSKMTHTRCYADPVVHWESIDKTPDDITCGLTFEENVEPLLRQAYKRSGPDEPPIYCDEIIEERSIQLRVSCQRLGTASTRVKFIWDINSPLDRTTSSEIIGTTINTVDQVLRDEILQLGVNTRIDTQFENISLHKSTNPHKELSWPTPQEYNEAVQNPALNFSILAICNGKLELSALGLPRPITGAFASVYRMYQADGSSIAVRCFLRPTIDHEDRYRTVSAYVSTDALEATIGFEFIDSGIRIGGSWYPIVRMEWLNGSSLSAFIEEHLSEPERLDNMASTFAEMIDTLQHAGIVKFPLLHGQ